MEIVLTCTCCKQVKPTSDFTRDRAKRNGFKSQCKACNNARETKRYHHRLRSGPYIAVTPEERERQAEIARLCGAMRCWGTVSWDGRFRPLRPMVRVELENAA
jgi:hypothetical protein